MGVCVKGWDTSLSRIIVLDTKKLDGNENTIQTILSRLSRFESTWSHCRKNSNKR